MSKKTNSNNYENCNDFNWSKLIIISLTTIATGIYRDGFSSIFPFLQREFNLSMGQLGFHSTFFFFSSAIFAVITGHLVDLKGSKFGLGYGILYVSFFLFLHSIVPNFIFLLIVATFTGIGVSVNVPASNKAVTEWFPQKWRGTAFGVISAALPFGGFLGALFLPLLGVIMGWRKAMLIPTGFALLCSIFVLNFYQDTQNEEKIVENNKKSVSLAKSFLTLLQNKHLLSISLFGFFIGSTAGSIAAHYALFLHFDCNLTENVAGFVFAIVQVGSFLGRIGWGLFYDNILSSNKRKIFLYIGFLFAALSLTLGLLYNKNNYSLIFLVLISFFIGYSGRGLTGLYLSTVADVVKESDIGTATGFSLLWYRFGLMATPPLFGYIADFRGAYDYSWFFLGFMMLIASIGQYLNYLKNVYNPECL